MKCQQYETKIKIITSRVNEHNCLRCRELERKGRRGKGEKEKVKIKKEKRQKENESTLKNKLPSFFIQKGSKS